MQEPVRILAELTAHGIALDLRGGEIVARGPAEALERFKPRSMAYNRSRVIENVEKSEKQLNSAPEAYRFLCFLS